MAFFGKEACGICGKEMRLGKRKVGDGAICADCESLLSPFFNGRRHSTLQAIRDQLAYREANKDDVARFRATRSLGACEKVLIDEGAGKFVVTSSGDWRCENPDVIGLSQVVGCDIEVRETRTEVKRALDGGGEESYDPPRWDVDYGIYVVVHVDSPWFDDIEIKTHSGQIGQRHSAEYDGAEQIALDIREALGRRVPVSDSPVGAA